jgi:hypothetical protein
MAVFAVLMPSPQPMVIERIRSQFPYDHLELNDTQYLISFRGTAIDLSRELGVYDPRNPSQPATGNAVVLATTSYFGRAPTTVWDWMKAKLETPPNG